MHNKVDAEKVINIIVPKNNEIIYCYLYIINS